MTTGQRPSQGRASCLTTGRGQHTDHMFDLIGTPRSPALRVAIHVLERFLAVISNTEKRVPVHEVPPDKNA